MSILICFFIFITVVLGILFFIEWKRIHNIKGEWEHNDKDKAIQMIIEDIIRAKKRIFIYGGKGNIYDNDSIIYNFKEAIKRGVNVEIILERDSFASTKIADLSGSIGNVSLINTKNKKLFDHHFRVVDYDYVYLEKPHLEASHDRWYKRLPNTRFLPGKYSKEFNKIRECATTLTL
jgi:sugar-specific transcriptional regulator TrmB